MTGIICAVITLLNILIIAVFVVLGICYIIKEWKD
jgi:hypothetical protein